MPVSLEKIDIQIRGLLRYLEQYIYPLELTGNKNIQRIVFTLHMLLKVYEFVFHKFASPIIANLHNTQCDGLPNFHRR